MYTRFANDLYIEFAIYIKGIGALPNFVRK